MGHRGGDGVGSGQSCFMELMKEFTGKVTFDLCLKRLFKFAMQMGVRRRECSVRSRNRNREAEEGNDP